MRCLMAWLYRVFFGLELSPPTRADELAQLERQRLALLDERHRIEFRLWANRTQIDLLLSEPDIDTAGSA
jgi:hypothetical protein